MADHGKLAPTVYTNDDVRAILAACNRRSPSGLRDAALIAVVYSGALRIHEALDLADHDIEFSGEMRGRLVVNHGKGDKQRFVWLPDSVLDLVEKWIARRVALGVKSETLFCTISKPEPGKQLGYEHVRPMLRRRSEKVLGKKRAHWHGMRHGAAVDMAIRDVALQDIQHALGHEHLSTTEVYLQGLMPMGVMAAGRSNNWLTA